MGISVTGNIKGLLTLDKQITFAAAQALTACIKEAQTEVTTVTKAQFTTRGTWYLPSNKFGFRVKTASKTNLSAMLTTIADWLVDHERGAVRSRAGKRMAQAVIGGARPNLAAKIPRRLKPSQLGKKAFVVQTSKGPALFYRKGRGKKKGLQILYWLDKSVKIKKKSVVVEPATKLILKRFPEVFKEKLAAAVASAK